MANVIPVQTTGAASPARARPLRLGKLVREQALPRVVLIAMSAIFILPFYWMLATALKPVPELSVYPPTLWPHTIRWANFPDAMSVFPFWQFFRNSTIVTALTALGAAISNPIVAYGFSRIDWPGRDKVFYLVLATVFIPFPVLIVALFDIFARLHWVNTFLPLVVPLFFGNAFWIFLMRQFFMQIPGEISDAARIDGANELQILFRIIMPQSWPALSAVSLFAALQAWNDFLGPLIYLQDPSKYTLAIGLTMFQSQSRYDIQLNLLMAASTLVVLPVVIVFLLFQRAFVEGVTLGSIK
ncbi:MAG TPA: carbohydrate ABC transporter permease [Thermomicrobiales bacterium]|nr:carbohydrate ABC transporter permease [Thermomicrobiales bacterium]